MNQNNKKYCTLYIARHGESTGNAGHFIQGHKDYSLTENGIEQARQTAEKLKDINFSAIYSSDLIRAKSTAEILKLERELEIKTSKYLRERSHGTWEGKHSDEYKIFFQNIFDKLVELSEDEQKKLKLADDIESDDEIMTRFMNQLRDISTSYLDKNVLVVSHGGPIRNLLMYLGFAKYGELQPRSFSNAGYVKVLCDGSDFVIQEVNGIIK
jgi:broad specificity phosphatase PhoE